MKKKGKNEIKKGCIFRRYFEKKKGGGGDEEKKRKRERRRDRDWGDGKAGRGGFFSKSKLSENNIFIFFKKKTRLYSVIAAKTKSLGEI